MPQTTSLPMTKAAISAATASLLIDNRDDNKTSNPTAYKANKAELFRRIKQQFNIPESTHIKVEVDDHDSADYLHVMGRRPDDTWGYVAVTGQVMDDAAADAADVAANADADAADVAPGADAVVTRTLMGTLANALMGADRSSRDALDEAITLLARATATLADAILVRVDRES